MNEPDENLLKKGLELLDWLQEDLENVGAEDYHQLMRAWELKHRALTSQCVKDPKDSYERVIDPAKEKTAELKKKDMSVHTYRWTMFADNDEDAWTALRSWRGLRAPSRLQQLDPEALRIEADSFPKEEIMGKFSKATTIEDLVNIYSPLVDEFDSDIVTIQISSINQEETIKLLGKELLPKLRK